MIRGAFSITFVGNRMLLIAPVRTPCASGSSSIAAVEAEQAADADQREAVAELEAGAELRGDDDEHREAGLAARAAWC